MKKKFFVATFVILFMFMIEGTLKKVKASDDLIGDEALFKLRRIQQ